MTSFARIFSLTNAELEQDIARASRLSDLGNNLHVFCGTFGTGGTRWAFGASHDTEVGRFSLL